VTSFRGLDKEYFVVIENGLLILFKNSSLFKFIYKKSNDDNDNNDDDNDSVFFDIVIIIHDNITIY
jgi:hypothetical protein